MKSELDRRLVPYAPDEAQFQEAWRAWQSRVVASESASRHQFETTPIWYPVEPSPSLRILGVYGGSAAAWAHLLTTLGPPLLTNGHVAILNLSRRLVEDALIKRAKEWGRPLPNVVSLPSEVSTVDLFGDLSPRELTSLLVEAIHANQRDPAISRHERQEDRAVLDDVARHRDEGRSLTFRWLQEGLQVVTKDRKPPVDASDILSLEEYEKLSELYGEVQRSHGGVLERASRLARLLKDLRLIDGSGQGNRDAMSRFSSQTGPGLDVFRIDRKVEELDNEMLVDVLFQLVLRRMRVEFARLDTVAINRPETLIILGADRVRRQDLESLTEYCEHTGVRAFLFFEHLRSETRELLGRGGAAAAFLALPNHREAQEAVDFIGYGHKWVESQVTRGYSNSTTTTKGSDHGGSEGPSGNATTWSDSTSTARGHSDEYSESHQRVFEPLIEPNVLMGLPLTGLIYVEVQSGGRRRVANVDFNPLIAASRRTSKRPFELKRG